MSAVEESNGFRLLMSIGVVPSGDKAIGVLNEASYVPELSVSIIIWRWKIFTSIGGIQEG